MLTVKLLSFTFEFWFKTKIKAIFGKDCPTMPPIGMRSAVDPYNLFSIIQEVKPRAQLQHWTLNLLSRLAGLVRETSLQRFYTVKFPHGLLSKALHMRCFVSHVGSNQLRIHRQERYDEQTLEDSPPWKGWMGAGDGQSFDETTENLDSTKGIPANKLIFSSSVFFFGSTVMVIISPPPFWYAPAHGNPQFWDQPLRHPCCPRDQVLA